MNALTQPEVHDDAADASVSIVIPVYNEAHRLNEVFASLAVLDPPALEVIVVDGQSTDRSVAVAREHGARVISAPERRRSLQLDLGARAARGEIVAFLHADTKVPWDALATMRQTLAEPEVALAAFTSIMWNGERVQRFTTWHNWAKTYYAPMLYRPFRGLFHGLRLLFGDQVMFCRRRDYEECGGFDPTMEIMEEADLCLKLNRLGRIRQLGARVYSSDRRVTRAGALRANLLFIYIALGWALGLSRERLRTIFDRM